ncbi:MAG: hypothetical protein KJO21_12695 [Verrucomicrobiae bacterium]|nr:hypothetical protein [Verrucomicrobiae bacterium]NNJ43585.1 hypothetical protein [Akkermansiaceae bacterium]
MAGLNEKLSFVPTVGSELGKVMVVKDAQSSTQNDLHDNKSGFVELGKRFALESIKLIQKQAG